MKGADNVVREIIRSAIASTFDTTYQGVNLQQIVQWFDLGGNIQLQDSAAAAELIPML